jgi:hypothetical protein
MMRLEDVPASVRETFSDYFKQFEGKATFEFHTKKFFATVNVDELIAKFGAERVERDYLALCKLDFYLQQLLKHDGVQL